MCQIAINTEIHELIPGIKYQVRFSKCFCYKDHIRYFAYAYILNKEQIGKGEYKDTLYFAWHSDFDKTNKLLPWLKKTMQFRIAHYKIKLKAQLELF